MATLDSVANFINLQASTGYDASATSITLKSGQGSSLPAAPFNLIWWDSTTYPNPANDPKVEIVRVTAISGDTLTITRAQESTTASTKNTADKTYSLVLGITAKMITDIADAIAAGGGSGTVTEVASEDGSITVSDGTTTPDLSVVSAPKLTTARNIDGQSFDGSDDITIIAPGTHAATGKTTPADADELPIVDSAASNVLKKLTWTNLKAALKSYFDSIYQAAGSYITASSADALTNKDLTSGTNTFPTFNQDTTGNAATADALKTARTIAGVSFDGSANISIGVDDLSDADTSTDPPTDGQVLTWNDTDSKWEPATASGTGDMLASTYDPNSVAADAFDMDNMVQGTSNKFVTAAEKTVLGNTSGTNTGDQTSVTGNAGTATKLATARNIAGIPFDGSADIDILASDVSAISSDDAPSGDIVGTSDSQTITNKRNEPRISSSTSTSTLTPSLSTANVFYLTAQAASLTIAEPTGTPVQGEVLAIYITDNGTSQTLTFNSAFKAYGTPLPTATTVSKTLQIIAQYDGTYWATQTAVQQ
jgi:hypothetical protein